MKIHTLPTQNQLLNTTKSYKIKRKAQDVDYFETLFDNPYKNDKILFLKINNFF